jgi:hypothetical protein
VTALGRKPRDSSCHASALAIRQVGAEPLKPSARAAGATTSRSAARSAACAVIDTAFHAAHDARSSALPRDSRHESTFTLTVSTPPTGQPATVATAVVSRPKQSTKVGHRLSAADSMGTWKRYTPRMGLVLHHASGYASATRSDRIGVEHLWLGLLSAGDGVALRVLSALDVDSESLRESIRTNAPVGEHGPDPDEPLTAESFIQGLEAKDRIQLSDDVHAVLVAAAGQSDDHVHTGHLLITLVSHGSAPVVERGLTVERVQAETARQLAEFLYGRPAAMDAALADELIAVPRASVPADIRALDARIAELRQLKEAAVDSAEFDVAARVRDQEKQLLRQRAQRVQDWAAGVDVLALAEEVEALRAEVDRLRDRGQ